MSLPLMGKSLIVVGATLVVIGVLLLLAPRIPLLGKLPGDIEIKRDNVEVYIPLATSLVLSALLSGILWLFRWWNSKP